MQNTTLKKTFSIRFTVVSIFIFSSILTATIAIALQYHFSQSMAHKSALKLYDFAADNGSSYFIQQDDKAANYVSLLANFTKLLETQTIHPETLKLFAHVLQKNEMYYSIYLGFANGDLLELVNLNQQQKRSNNLHAEKSDRWVLISVTGQKEQRVRQLSYFDESFNLRTERQEKSSYDATKRLWYQNATTSKVYKSDAYVYALSNLLGQTFSKKIANTGTVLALDITLDALSSTITELSRNKKDEILSEVYFYQKNGQLLSSNQNIKAPNNGQELATVPYPILTELSEKPENFHQLQAVTINNTDYYLYIAPMDKQYGQNNYLAILISEKILLADSIKQIQTSIAISSICLILLLPLAWLFASPIVKPIKALAIETEKVKLRHYEQLQPISSNITEIQELNDSMVDMSQSIESYQAEQKQLMESFIQLIAQAIDDKSPYTAGHCNRVPELGLMLAAAAEASNLPPFDAFKFKNNDEHREFSIAAWLHDCGKITTPEYIVDKGTKLETIYNRIHEVRMRFEVLWRDAEINYYQQVLTTPEQEQGLKDALNKQQQQLINDFQFIAKSNVGSEFMSEQDILRVQQIAEQTWLRHFDDKLGLSPIEELNLEGESKSLPAIEKLLSDKNKHIIKRDRKVEFDPKFDIKMETPEHLYNLGEIYNLSIERGTLTTEDRFKINQHITSTIKMLENLPFPDELAKVPRYASTHHETLIGTGYPRKLSAEDLSIPERILVLADIFEALTAADRPYKKAKPLSVAINILHKMTLDQHIDMDIFKLFLSSGIYLQYAHKFLDKKQIDDVDIDQYLT
ncbi:hypothetical protein N8878_03735 [Psychromonas sp.]|nr:hypothetical protein [Psychromonas sp.]